MGPETELWTDTQTGELYGVEFNGDEIGRAVGPLVKSNGGQIRIANETYALSTSGSKFLAAALEGDRGRFEVKTPQTA